MEIFTDQPKKLNIAKDRLIKGSDIPELSYGYRNVQLIEIPNYFIPVNVNFAGKTKLIDYDTPYDIEMQKPKWNKPHETLKVRYYAVNTLFGTSIDELFEKERKKQDVI